MRWLFCFTVVVAGIRVAVAQPCQPGWSDAFAGGDINGTVRTAAIFNDGTGPGLYLAGDFTRVGGVLASRIARWDGQRWSPLGTAFESGNVNALAVFNDGSGAALYAAGVFNSAGGVAVHNIARWDGQSWSAVGDQTVADVRAMAVFDGGAGASLYVAGMWPPPGGGAPARQVARLDGSTWTALGTFSGTALNALASFDDGTGPSLYAGGRFASVNGVTAQNIVRWTGAQWESLVMGPFLPSSSAILNDMHVHEGRLVVAGSFTEVDGVPASRIASWNGSSWSAMPGLPGSAAVQTVHVAGQGPGELYAGGSLPMSRWDGSAWTMIGPTNINAIAEFDGGLGSLVYAGGSFTSAGGVPAERIAAWDGQAWMRVGGMGLNSSIWTFRVDDDGAGPALYAGGWFTAAGRGRALRIARWSGDSWQALGDGLGSATVGSNRVTAIEIFDSGQGSQLYASTLHSQSAWPLSHVVRWDGSMWHAVGLSEPTFALRVFDDGAGPALFSGFNGPSSLRRWTGQGWTAIAPNTSRTISALEILESAAGPRLIVGGRFQMVGTLSVNYIAQWDGDMWSHLGSPPGVWGAAPAPLVETMTVYDTGSGPTLYIGGNFLLAGGGTVNNIARWDGTSWSALAQGVSGPVYAIAGFDDRTMPALYVTGDFTSASGTPAQYIARWNGHEWSPLGAGLSNPGYALASFDDGRGEGLYVGGSFQSAGGLASQYIARWGCATAPDPTCYANCDGSTIEPILNVDDFTCFINEFAAAQTLPHPQQIEHYANCDGSTTAPVLNVDDFTCFINAFAAGCP